jgi:hypothetical protein
MGLVNMIAKQDASMAAFTLERLDVLVRSWWPDREIVHRLAMGLVNLVAKQETAAARNTMDRLEALAQAMPEDQEIALRLAQGLVKLIRMQDLPQAVSTVERLKVLTCTWPTNLGIALQFAKGLLFTGMMQIVSGNSPDSTLRELEIMEKQWEKSPKLQKAISLLHTFLIDFMVGNMEKAMMAMGPFMLIEKLIEAELQSEV